ncbi:MAG: type II toxin-antitoxin system YafQ family toxin [Treponema sp.]|jgi:mRNA interferase YafQ|nr:type II toxin-antitoxin system YafQ family toxin [Treponema sp.]
MLTPVFSNQFKKDYALSQKRQRDMDKISEVMALLIMEESLPEKHRDHPLHGGYEGTRECHIQGDWLLIYESKGSDITFYRTGTHSDLF